MRKNGWLAILMVMVLPALLFTVSCAKKSVEAAPAVTQPSTTPTDSAQDKAERDRLAAQAAAMNEAFKAFSAQDISFDFDSSALRPDAQQILKSKAALMQANPEVKAVIEGHCDDRGTDAYNMALGERRADSARAFLVNLGIAAKRLSTISYGEEKPLDLGGTEAAYAKNRRAHFVNQ
ncbi:MAG: peptidoglycan-associated lipoprotein Pal [Desulfatitalea sp.]